ncbi:adenylate kinase 7-like [Lampris incognitus]|uniref:adenylate kinase 7-like n=1 Tax=Lampris incognitus TaxID=2546036 RepID=UPI0024B4C4F3|nr:adenylate kinase 7-like [Lampris incognitus]
MDDRKRKLRPKRVFVNNVDRYSSKHVATFLSNCVAGERAEEADGDGDPTQSRSSGAFQVVGTASCAERNAGVLLQQHSQPPGVTLERLLECDVVLYNITEKATEELMAEVTWAITGLHAEMESFTSQKIFILVSTVMTWALTKPKDPDESDAPLTEEDYRRKRPHPNFRNHSNLEKLVLKLGRAKKSKLISYVVASGLLYGKEENVFHQFFKKSWLMDSPSVSVFGPGTNYIPVIHVYDLGRVIQNIIDLRPKSRYILAVDDSADTLEDIIMMLSAVLGPGKVKKVPKEEAMLKGDLEPEELDCLSINLHLESVCVKDLNLNWACEAGMVENMERIVEEYKDSRHLLPIRICLFGPPAVGKTTVAEKLCKHYQVHHIKLKIVIEEKISQLEEILRGGDPERDDDEEAVAAAKEQLETIQESIKENKGQLADHLVCHILQEKLNSMPCRNHGFVLDGFPNTYQQAKLIFTDEDINHEDLKPQESLYNKMITPEHVFALEASDDFLIKRVQGLPQGVSEKMQYTQEEFVPRLERYRQGSNVDESLLDYFDELELHPVHIDINKEDPEYTDVMKKITKVVGAPRNYGLGPEEQEKERQLRFALEATEKKKRMDEAALVELKANYEEWNRNVSEVKRQEYELLEARSLPLRNYLMKYVMPSLTEALVDCSKVRPEDPVDFLAEYLLRKNSQE